METPSLSRMERSVLVLDAIEARIMENPGIFHTFITVLQKDVVLQKFAGSLIDSYRKSPSKVTHTYIINYNCIFWELGEDVCI